MMKLVYLAGPITGDTNPQVWRRDAAQQLPKGWGALDPCSFELDGQLDTPEKIVRTDLHYILQASVILARVDVPSWGTAMELMFARNHSIPVIGFGVDHADRLSPWLRYVCNYLAEDLNEAMDVLRNVRDDV